MLLVTRDIGAHVPRRPDGAARDPRTCSSDVKNQHSAGGWSQARFERSVEQEVEWHLEAATDLLFRHFKRRPFDHLVIGANNEALRPALTGETHAYLAERIRGWVDIDERSRRRTRCSRPCASVMDAHLAAQEQALFERFAAEQGTDGRAAAGLDEVLAALVEQRVETLLVREGAAAPGMKCVTCGWLGPAALRRCPVDETALDERRQRRRAGDPGGDPAVGDRATCSPSRGRAGATRRRSRAGRGAAALLSAARGPDTRPGDTARLP